MKRVSLKWNETRLSDSLKAEINVKQDNTLCDICLSEIVGFVIQILLEKGFLLSFNPTLCT